MSNLWVHDVEQAVPGTGPRQTTNLPPVVVGRQAMVTAPLDVQREQVEPKVQVTLKQVVCQLFWEKAVETLRRLSRQSANKVVQCPILIEDEGSELVVAELQVLTYIAETG